MHSIVAPFCIHASQEGILRYTYMRWHFICERGRVGVTAFKCQAVNANGFVDSTFFHFFFAGTFGILFVVSSIAFVPRPLKQLLLYNSHFK